MLKTFSRLRRSLILVAASLITLIVPGAAGEAQVPDPSAAGTVIRRCVMEYERNTPIGSPIFSTFKECLVEPGAVVKAGQILGRLQDDDVRADVKLREAEANSDIDVRLSEAKSAKAQSKAARTASLVRKNAASLEEFNEHRLEAAVAVLEIEQAKHRRKIAAIQVEASKTQLNLRCLISPHDGVVAILHKRQGESVAPRDPILQVVDTSTLRVIGQVDVTDAWHLHAGQPVRVIVEIAGADLPVEHEVFPGKIIFVDSQIDPLTRTCKVLVRTENRANLLRAGLEARIEIDPVHATTTK